MTTIGIGRFSTATWSPIRYIYGCVSQAELAGFYRDADVALVTLQSTVHLCDSLALALEIARL